MRIPFGLTPCTAARRSIVVLHFLGLRSFVKPTSALFKLAQILSQMDSHIRSPRATLDARSTHRFPPSPTSDLIPTRLHYTVPSTQLQLRQSKLSFDTPLTSLFVGKVVPALPRWPNCNQASDPCKPSNQPRPQNWPQRLTLCTITTATNANPNLSNSSHHSHP